LYCAVVVVVVVVLSVAVVAVTAVVAARRVLWRMPHTIPPTTTPQETKRFSLGCPSRLDPIQEFN
jgi:hypothetical protein